MLSLLSMWTVLLQVTDRKSAFPFADGCIPVTGNDCSLPVLYS